jgi:alkylresorcinol/alkylpyrone synthase
MPKIISISQYSPPYQINQEASLELAKELFEDSFSDIERLLSIFANGQIDKRYVSAPIEWFREEHSFEEKNNLYIELATRYGVQTVSDCLQSPIYLAKRIDYKEIDAIFFVSSSGISTPSVEARVMNQLPFSPHTKRVPLWGLGCAGGASGLSRAYDYCLAYPESKVLVLSVELCSLTFQRNDKSKSNLVGTSLFADGVACILMVGNQVEHTQLSKLSIVPHILGTQSTLMPNSEDVMGWEVKNEGLFVIFSKDIPHIIKEWLRPNVEDFLQQYKLSSNDIHSFIAHPGGKKVLDAYIAALGLPSDMLTHSLHVLKNYGNMSSATVFYVLNRFMQDKNLPGQKGIITALGPGFSSELLLVEWK